MPIDFHDISQKSRQAHEQRIADHEKQKEIETKDRYRKAEERVLFLRENIEPLLEEARTAFKESDLDLEIKQEYDVKMFVDPRPYITVALSQLDPSRTDGYRVRSLKLKFSYDGKGFHGEIEVGPISKETGREQQKKLSCASENKSEIHFVVESLFSTMSENFYAVLEKYRGIYRS